MRWLYIVIIIVLVAAPVIFAFQNPAAVTLSFLGFSARAPLALLIAGSYVLGALSGGSLYALLRRSYTGSRFGAAT